MRNSNLLYLFSIILLVIASVITANAQSNTAIGNYPDGKVPTIFQTDTPGDSCIGAGLEQHDGSLHANGYTQFTDSVRFVIKFHPQSYPWTYNKYCQAFTTVGGGVTSHAYDIVVYDTLGAGGSPGSLLAVFPGNTATGIANFSAYTWNSAVMNYTVTATQKAVYIGCRFNNTASQPFYVTADESSPLWPGYCATNTSGPPVWATIQTTGGSIFPNYKCMAMRTFGTYSIAPLCEQFTSVTFPPINWTEVFTGTNYWTRATQSGFGIGVGSAKYDNWAAPTGTNQSLITSPFPATNPAGIDSIYVDVAYQPNGTAQDSLVILGSTNQGITYTSVIARLGPAQLTTTTGQPSPFVPTSAAMWKKLRFAAGSSTNTIQFIGKSGFGDNLYIDSICTWYWVGIQNHEYEIPVAYSLSQNYPNPFNPTTEISYGLPKAGNVNLVVFDILGREVKTLIDEFKPAGNYNVTFDGTNLASGIYFYSITSGDFIQTKKMLMIK